MATIDPKTLKGKKVLVFGLGLLGGGVATTNWLIKHGAIVTVTDIKTKDQLALSISKVKGSVIWHLGDHNEADIRDNEIIVFNPDVPISNPYLALAKKLGKHIENEATIFYQLCPSPIVAITGTRGKTTTTNWTAHLLGVTEKKAIVTGNSYKEPLLKTLDQAKRYAHVVNEVPSFHLEFFDQPIKGPNIAIITNISQDHLNRYESFEHYASTKGNIFRHQTPNQHLILNYQNSWTQFFVNQKPSAQVWFFSIKKLPKKLNGIYLDANALWLQKDSQAKRVLSLGSFIKTWGEHNLQNLMAAVLAAHLSGESWQTIKAWIATLPQIPFRQETIFQNKKLTIINDTTATSPEGCLAAVRRFASDQTILITGGTDRQLDFKDWGKQITKYIRPDNIVMLEGSATTKMLEALGKKSQKIATLPDLKSCVDLALSKASHYKKATILFSPASKSFEKFNNEFDRGEQFNALVKKLIKRL